MERGQGLTGEPTGWETPPKIVGLKKGGVTSVKKTHGGGGPLQNTMIGGEKHRGGKKTGGGDQHK